MEIKLIKIVSMRSLMTLIAIFSKKMFKQTLAYMIKLQILQKKKFKDCKFGVNLHSFVSYYFLSHSFIALTIERLGRSRLDPPSPQKKISFKKPSFLRVELIIYQDSESLTILQYCRREYQKRWKRKSKKI